MAKKVVLITGASSGIGLVSALQLIKDGHKVYGVARRVDPMQPIKEAGGEVLACDVTDDASMSAAVDAVLKAEGRIDVLVNNAGYGLYGAVEDVPMDDARHQLEVNIFGLARMIQLVLPQMRARGSGRIINVSSVGGAVYMPLGGWYHATKHALEGFSDCLRVEIARHGIDVVVICPGLIKTGFVDVMAENLMRVSGSGAYAKMAHALIKGGKRMAGSDPQCIADDISHAVKAKKPKTRYRSGRMSRRLLWMRRLLTDRMFDRLISGVRR